MTKSTGSEPQTGSNSRKASRLFSFENSALLLLVVGSALRLYHFAAGRSLWTDEARLSLNILSRDYGELLRPLAYDQSAPPLFLWIERLTTSLFGPTEISLRILPLLAGILGLVLLYQISRRLQPAGLPQLLILFWGACGPLFVYYSNEVKPYSLDMLVALLLIHEALRHIASTSGVPGRGWWLLVLGMIAPWASTPGVFPLAAVLIALGARAVSDRSGRRRTLAYAITWGLSAGAAYWLVYSKASENQYLHEYWSEGMIRIGIPGAFERAAFALQDWYAGTFFGLPTHVLLPPGARPILYGLTALLLIIGVMGVFRVFRKWKGGIGVLLVGPPAMGLLASSLGMYPISFRLMFFAVPSVLILTAAGLEHLLSKFRLPLRRMLWPALGIALCVFPLQRNLGDLREPRRKEHLRPAVAFIDNSSGLEEAVYVMPGALPGWIYYTTDWESPDYTRLRLAAKIGSSGGAAFENASESELGTVPDLRLTYRSRSGVEAFGRAAGVQLKYSWAEEEVPLPPEDWAVDEALRIRRLGPSSLILVAHTPAYQAELFRALQNEGAEITVPYMGAEVEVLRCTFTESET